MTKGVTVYLYARTRGAATFFWFVFLLPRGVRNCRFYKFPFRSLNLECSYVRLVPSVTSDLVFCAFQLKLHLLFCAQSSRERRTCAYTYVRSATLLIFSMQGLYFAVTLIHKYSI